MQITGRYNHEVARRECNEHNSVISVGDLQVSLAIQLLVVDLLNCGIAAETYIKAARTAAVRCSRIPTWCDHDVGGRRARNFGRALVCQVM